MSDYYEPAKDWSAADIALGLPSDTGIERLVDAIEFEHRGQADETAAWRQRENRKVGLLGQRHMARTFRLPMDTTVRRYGTKKAPFALNDGMKIAVVTRLPVKGRSAPDLTAPWPPRTNADAWVLVVWHGALYEPEVAGWATRDDLEGGDVGKYKDGIENRVLHPSQLRPFWELMARHDPDSKEAIPPPIPDPILAYTPSVPSVVQTSLF